MHGLFPQFYCFFSFHNESGMKILFVCIGNTCRSPMAESVMSNIIIENGLNWQTDSAALRSWNVDRLPEERCQQVLAENGLNTQHIGREITPEDFEIFDFILGMDAYNMSELSGMSSRIAGSVKCKAKVELLGSYIGRKEDEIIPDPYFSTGIGGFRSAYAQINESCRNFVQKHK